MDDEIVEDGDQEAQNLEQQQQRDDDGVVQAEMCSGFSESHVFSFDRYPQLYLRSKELLQIKKEGKIEIVEDSTDRRPSYSASASLAFPHLYANGEMSPLDFQDYKLVRHLLKSSLCLLIACQMKNCAGTTRKMISTWHINTVV